MALHTAVFSSKYRTKHVSIHVQRYRVASGWYLVIPIMFGWPSLLAFSDSLCAFSAVVLENGEIRSTGARGNIYVYYVHSNYLLPASRSERISLRQEIS